MSTISVASLAPADKEGWLTKQGGSWKSWKRRWIVLKGETLFYFKTRKDKDVTGTIELTKDSFTKKDDKKKYCFAVGTEKRVFFMFPDTQIEQDEWMNTIGQVIDNLRKPSSGPGAGAIAKGGSPEPQPTPTATASGPIAKLRAAVQVVPFLQVADSKPLEFWEIWQESIPEESCVFKVAVTLDLSQLSWRCVGPQNKLIQKMVDFFWNVGAPETEIDRLNDVGTLINPLQIGSWIDMSAKGGMDGGWFFPCELPLKLSLEASDPGEATKKVSEWAQSHGFDAAVCVGRDMGAAPPRQTQFIFDMLEPEFEKQLQTAMSAYDAFGFPHPPQEAMDVIRTCPTESKLSLTVICSSEGFVKLGMITPPPDANVRERLCAMSSGGNQELLQKFEKALGADGIEFVEYKYLAKSFGYGVYKEGFDVVFHYTLG
mmetsp:Transcript_26623/g.29675  ORF Transcript_26623/g.29675 Transcript_26623/m.29675 type:complete len:429 (+) Transcript_26623:2072-3358(+)|eukprot:CAMPEP_0168515014 /NCGR_PEP_ID=MMETSP0405-20121227/4472_1 /TAXON_ID=498012 /ORGANISM="Trichosphaerium sp, Strain Am-I-7 wt" /LENGTH=428 /DNA_ID=CAMNT_0008534289 /DNA_START=841 /DNA_END=2127 /DNA_ORIENTATION=-